MKSSSEQRAFPLDVVGSRIRQERKKLGITIEQLANNVGVSQGLISQIENGQTSPSLETLWKISSYLQIPIFHFFKSISSSDTYITRREEQREMKMLHPNIIYRLLSPSVFTNFEIFEMIVEPGDVSALPKLAHRGVEFGYILEGEIVVQLEHEMYHLQKGDSIYFKSSQPHRFFNPSTERSKGIWVMFPNQD